MLKALELAGFKSFADKTRFDFPDGITVVVGPNGSGKSNIVDAMKWVLGSQSAKSLRGKDMSDVIFKGSQTRGPAGSAEVTIVFDNPDGALPVDSPEVRVTRRVYRSGEGEYLINGAAVRLKDVRNLIRGTGIGIDAYSLIEQGKVDKMLNAGAKDRRVIFEEAAGISRFKAKKVEAERRLKRVQTNLTRLGDIVDEVGSRLKSLRGQASKAERYRQSSERMRELRTALGWTDWTALASEIDQLDREWVETTRRRDQAQQDCDDLAIRRQSADAQLQTIADRAGEIEQQRLEITTAIAAATGRRDADREMRRDLAGSLKSQRRQTRVVRTTVRQSNVDLDAAAAAAKRAEAELDDVTIRSQAADKERLAVASELEQLRQRRDQINQNVIATARQLGDLESKQIRSTARLSETARSLATMAGRQAAAKKDADAAARTHLEVAERLQTLNGEILAIEKEVEIAASEVNQTRRNLERRRDEVASLQLRRQGVVERHKVLADLEARQEGLSIGVREVIKQLKGSTDEGHAAASDSPTGPDPASSTLGGSVIGLVADCFEADVEIASLIDAALGPHCQYIVARGDQLQRRIIDGTMKIKSRIGVIRIDELPPRRAGDRIRLDGLKGVIGRADRMVRCSDQHQPVVRHLLSATWLVDSIATAIGLRKLSGAGLRFVTANGELLENDGSVVIGPQAMSTGLVSRRSELVSAAKEIAHYEFQLTENTNELERCRIQLDDQTAALGRIEDRLRGEVTRRAGLVAEVRHANDAVASRSRLVDEVEREMAAIELERVAAQRDAAAQKQSIMELGQKSETLQSDLAEIDEAASSVSESLAAIGSGVNELTAQQAQKRQDFEVCSARYQAARRDADQRQQQVDDCVKQLTAMRTKIAEVGSRILSTDDQLAHLAINEQQTAESLRQLAIDSATVKAENREVMQASEAAIKTAATTGSAVQSITSKLENVRLRRDSLASRLKDDYEIDLHAEEVPEDFQAVEDREQAEAEINSLRGQLQKTTNVNMEALAELEELQTRYDQLHGQYQDLTAAKDSLQRMIGRINADSRRLFLDTLEAIRINFQQLYRKSFGGGHADLILEDSDDPLEAGVEIVATPPGKPSFNNSLLSGGEKALTAVALLMSIFKYRPSPFCVLDEVDAPFDEANIGRFVTVLSEFLDHSKFVVVTHSKKTMTAATTLYGVTMQESGVSKQVSIRFEDVSDDGEIAAA